ncbi:hypothetical protein RHD99_00165 [Buttiauxella selenatireducens]|uniref:Lipoprotein n=1 Tax=Buttiauxella selenatireducens TaxID=3073902 RepID=A0ABY9SAH2_9ENTR|nr:hypothetical protein [Buttiauxella sp. R73]WMY74442.1 hypothetical protein RHD99_00165 [Buttiauxella sp. R73]
MFKDFVESCDARQSQLNYRDTLREFDIHRAGSGKNMAYKFALLLLIPFAILGCASRDTSGYDGHRTYGPTETDEFMRSQQLDPLNNRENLTPEQRKAISEQMRAERLEARGRMDNSTDSGDGFGQAVPRGFSN